ncbi:MAG: dTDP-4-dehydrorhamnose reductase [Planctomycetaceae bacterium]|nr:dTDP-4-dehydrorhamnose reductase [Planctomycetaceae bacterium]
MRILLTGKDGQLAWELRQRLAQNHDVIAVGREEIDFRNASLLHDMLRKLPKLDMIVNCAAYTDVDRAEREPLIPELINVEAPAILAAEADRCGIPIIHFSTDYIFDGKKGTNPYTEKDRPNPFSVYGWSKLAGEQRVRELCEKHLIFRVSGLYGTRRRNFLTTMLKFLAAGESPRVVDDQVVSPNWCPMVAEAVEHVINRIFNGMKTEYGIFHLTGTGSTTWYEFARMIFEKMSTLHKKPLITPQAVSSEEYGAEAKRPAYSVLNPNKFTQTFGYVLPNWQTQFLHCVNVMTSLREAQ